MARSFEQNFLCGRNAGKNCIVWSLSGEKSFETIFEKFGQIDFPPKTRIRKNTCFQNFMSSLVQPTYTEVGGWNVRPTDSHLRRFVKTISLVQKYHHQQISEKKFYSTLKNMESQSWTMNTLVSLLISRKLRPLMIAALCSYGNEDCLSDASDIYQRWMRDPTGTGRCVFIEMVATVFSNWQLSCCGLGF